MRKLFFQNCEQIMHSPASLDKISDTLPIGYTDNILKAFVIA